MVFRISLKDRIKKSGKVFIVGVGGDSGSGKTTFVKGIEAMLGADIVSSFSLDDYHTLDRKQRAEKKITPLNPAANNLVGLAKDLSKLKRGEPIMKPVYDHKDGSFGKPVLFKPTPVIIIEGLHPFYTEKLRKNIDLSIFVEPDREIKKKWKIKRDVEERGHKIEAVVKEMKLRAPDYEKYIDEQKIYAEVIVQIAKSTFSEDDIYQIRLVQRRVSGPLAEMDLSLDLSEMLRLSDRNFALEFKRDDFYGHDVGILSMDGEIHRSVVKNLEEKICGYTGKKGACILPTKEEYISTREIAQLIICWRFMEKMNNLLRK
jgi:phosphoribulokinase